MSQPLGDLWNRAVHDVATKRGGKALLASLCGDESPEALLASSIAVGALWIAEESGNLQGFALWRGEVIEALYVAVRSRRQKVASSLIAEMLRADHPPLDAYALPGDRAMKSLYESIGWKARLLTMRGA